MASSNLEDDVRFHVLDTETVGFNPFDHGGGVCEISVREVDENANEIAHYESLLNPEGPISAGATSIHGIFDHNVANMPTMGEWLTQVLPHDIWEEDLPGVFLIAHNAPFDMRFLSPYIRCHHIVVDTLVLARRYYPDAENHKLPTLAVTLGLESFSAKDAHGAAQDTLVLVEFVRKLMEDTGYTLTQLCADSLRVDPITVMPFGKHKGRKIEVIKRDDPKYVAWCLENLKDLQPALRAALES